MNVTGSDAPEERTRVDPEPPAFPRVSTDSSGDQRAPAVDAGSIFSRPETAPVEPTASPGGNRDQNTQQSGGSRYRWLIAIFATIAVVAVVGGLALAMSPRAGTPSVTASYAPADTVALLEVRLDLPGDQHDKLAQLMSHFPGFADPQAFDRKLEESLAQVFASAEADLDWATDIDPWFGGEISVFSSTLNPTAGASASFTAAMTVSDRAALDVVLNERLTAAGATSEDYQGQPVWTMTATSDTHELALAATDEVLLIGTDAAQVKSALDVRADRANGLADDSFYTSQLAELHADRLGTFYLDARSAAVPLLDNLPADQANAEMLSQLVDLAAVRVVGELRAETDHLAFVARTERSAGTDLPPMPANGRSDLAESAPADVLVYVEVRQAGAMIGYLLDKALQPSASPSGAQLDSRMLEQLLGTAPRDYFDFVKDAAAWGSFANDQLDAGLVALVDDQAVAQQRVDRLLGTIRSLSAFGGEFTVEEEQHGGVTVTVISLGGMLGSTPVGSISVALTDGRLLIGVGDFVANTLGQAPAENLASRADYRDAVAAAGTSNAGVAFVDLAALRGMVEARMTADGRASYEQDKQPFVELLSHLVLVRETDGTVMVNNVFLYVE
jgi:citrate lyase gamma subunit